MKKAIGLAVVALGAAALSGGAVAAPMARPAAAVPDTAPLVEVQFADPSTTHGYCFADGTCYSMDPGVERMPQAGEGRAPVPYEEGRRGGRNWGGGGWNGGGWNGGWDRDRDYWEAERRREAWRRQQEREWRERQRAEDAYTADAHVRWCHSRYRSYRAWDNSWQPNNGPRRQCRSPYG